MLWARNGVWLGLVWVEKAIGGVMLGEAFGSEFLKEIFASILLQGLHVMKDG